MKLLDEQRLPLETCKARALNALDARHPQPASSVAHHIWPDHEMKPQGAGAAASRILVLLKKEGKAMSFSLPAAGDG